MESLLLQGLADKSLNKNQVFERVLQDWDLLPDLIRGISSPKPSVRYGCGKVLVDLSEKNPEKLYPYMEVFVKLLGGKHRILVWNATAIIANLCTVDTEKKFEKVFNQFYGLLDDPYLITVANIVGSSGKIALAKPELTSKIIRKLLGVEKIALTPHLTEECKRVVAEKTIETFDSIFNNLNQKDKSVVVDFAKRNIKSSRKTLASKASKLAKRYNVD